MALVSLPTNVFFKHIFCSLENARDAENLLVVAPHKFRKAWRHEDMYAISWLLRNARDDSSSAILDAALSGRMGLVQTVIRHFRTATVVSVNNVRATQRAVRIPDPRPKLLQQMLLWIYIVSISGVKKTVHDAPWNGKHII